MQGKNMFFKFDVGDVVFQKSYDSGFRLWEVVEIREMWWDSARGVEDSAFYRLHSSDIACDMWTSVEELDRYYSLYPVTQPKSKEYREYGMFGGDV